MNKVQKIEHEIESLSDTEFAELADRIAQRRAALFDAKIEQDAIAGHLDALARQALNDHLDGKSVALIRTK